MSNEMNELFEHLQEGILVFKDNTINFTNKIFHNILTNIHVVGTNDQITDQILDHKIFKLHENEQLTNANND